VVLRDRQVLAGDGMVVVIATIEKRGAKLLGNPDIISRGFIYLRDSEELMNLIRQYLKQKVARLFNGRKIDHEAAKKELRDELTHLLYDQTRRTPIVIPVINEIGGNGSGAPTAGGKPQTQRAAPKAPFTPKSD
jgi:ribonuclease J